MRRLVGSPQRASATTARLAELQELTTDAEQRLAEVHAQEAALKREQIDEADLATALMAFDPIWDALSPKEQARIVHLLVEQVTEPVRWIECVQTLVAEGVTRMVEVGPKNVLSGLVRRIDKTVEVWNVEDRASLEKTLAALRA